MQRHAKANKFKRSLSQNQGPILSENLYEYQFSAALIHHESKILGGSLVFKFEFSDIMWKPPIWCLDFAKVIL